MEEGRWQDGALADREFHQRLMDIAGNSLLLQMSRVFWFVRKSVRENVHDPRKTLDDHLSILSAIGSADPERAERAMREHIRRGGTQVAQALADPTAVRWVVDAPDGAVTPDMECGYGRP
jgi:DNA-binding GntR family transcriptional regulator